jgi:hypothetical protein
MFTESTKFGRTSRSLRIVPLLAMTVVGVVDMQGLLTKARISWEIPLI